MIALSDSQLETVKELARPLQRGQRDAYQRKDQAEGAHGRNRDDPHLSLLIARSGRVVVFLRLAIRLRAGESFRPTSRRTPDAAAR